jgi:hypothetical protein
LDVYGVFDDCLPVGLPDAGPGGDRDQGSGRRGHAEAVAGSPGPDELL